MTATAFGIRAATFRVSGCREFLGELRAVGAARGTRIICFNADLMAGRAHAEAAILRASRAVEAGTAISASLEMEALLSASGNRQCAVAERFGIHEGENRAWVCLVPPVEEAFGDLARIMQFAGDDRDWELIPAPKQALLRETFGISPQELAAAGGPGRLRDLVLERVALLEVYR